MEEHMLAKFQTSSTTVLVAEGEESNRIAHRVMLEGMGYRVIEAENGHAAVDLAFRKRPDLIVLEMRIPILNGLNATRKIRQNPLLVHIPIIAISFNDLKSTGTVALAAGCNAYIGTPVDFDRLKLIIKELLPAGPDLLSDVA
jgi:CheY-like chemotaxis protein